MIRSSRAGVVFPPGALDKAISEQTRLWNSWEERRSAITHSEAWEQATTAARMMGREPHNARWQGAGSLLIEIVASARLSL